MERKLLKPMKYSFCHSSFIYNNIQNFKGKSFVIDTRDQEHYNKSSLPGSINLNYHRISRHLESSLDSSDLSQLSIPHLVKTLDDEELSKFNDRKRRFCMIMVSETSLLNEFVSEIKNLVEAEERSECFEIMESEFNDTLHALLKRIQEENSVTLGLELYKVLRKDRVQEVHILIDGVSDFFERYPYLQKGYNSPVDSFKAFSKPVVLHYDLPHDILDGKLFLGNFNQARQFDILQKLKIKRIVNSAHECDNVHEDKGIKYKKLWIRDETDDNVSQYFKEVHDFIEEVFNEEDDCAVLVHCALGKSRSAIMVIMYIMKKFGWNYSRAFDYVKKRRQIISPHDGFVRELEELERKDFNFEEFKDN